MNQWLASAVVILVLVVAVAGGWWYFNQSSEPATSEINQLSPTQTTQQNANTANKATTPQPSLVATSRTYTGAGFEAVVPSSWKVVTDAPGEEGHVSFRSADYSLKSSTEVNERMGESKNWVKTGMILEVFPQGNEVTGSWVDPAEYVRFHSDMNYSNLVAKKEISLGGQPALLSRVRGDDGSISEGVRTVRNGREFQITFRFASETSVDWAVWNQFLSSFKFISASPISAWQTYRSSYGFEIQYPYGWKVVNELDSKEYSYSIAPILFNAAFGTGTYGNNGYDGEWFVVVYDKASITVEKLIGDMGVQFTDRQEKRANITISGVSALKVVVTTPSVPSWIYEAVIIEKGNRVYFVHNGAIEKDTFREFYSSFKFI